MKKNKGFTLVELLAVIIVLAIIMVIAIPTVTTVMNNSRKNALYEYALKVSNKAYETFLGNSAELTGIQSTNCDFYNIDDLMNGQAGSYQGYAKVVTNRSGDSPTYEVYISIRDTNYAVDNIHMNSPTMTQSKFLNEVEAHKGTTITLTDCSGQAHTIQGGGGGGSGTTKKTNTTTPTEPSSQTPLPTTSLLLASLEVPGYTINFNKNTTTYTLNVDANVTSITVNATAEYPNDVTVDIQGNNNLNPGRNTVSITVTNKTTNEKRTYTIIVIRKEEGSDPTDPTNPTSESVSSSDETTTSSNETTTQNEISSSNTTTSSDVSDNTTTSSDVSDKTSTTTVRRGNSGGWSGTRRTTKPTTAWDPNSGKPAPVDPTSDSSLNLISIGGYNIRFSSTVYEYDLNSKGEDKLSTINYRPTNKNAKVEISGNENLSKGGVITIKVTSENGFYTSEYNIYVTPIKQKSFIERALPYIAVVLGAAMVILITKISSQRKKTKERIRKRETEEEVMRMKMNEQMQNINAQVQNQQVSNQNNNNVN